jgi:hypothetical protein
MEIQLIQQMTTRLRLPILCACLYSSIVLPAIATPEMCQTVADRPLQSCVDPLAYSRTAWPIFFACPNFGVRHRWGMGAGIEYSPPPSYSGVFSSCDFPPTTIDVDKQRKDWLPKREWRRAFAYHYSYLYWYSGASADSGAERIISAQHASGGASFNSQPFSSYVSSADHFTSGPLRAVEDLKQRYRECGQRVGCIERNHAAAP